MAKRSVPAQARIVGAALDPAGTVTRQLITPHAIAKVRHMIPSCVFHARRSEQTGQSARLSAFFSSAACLIRYADQTQRTQRTQRETHWSCLGVLRVLCVDSAPLHRIEHRSRSRPGTRTALCARSSLAW